MILQDQISQKYGMPPGSLVYTGKKKAEEAVVITLIDYNGEELIEKTEVSLEDCEFYINRDSVTWINISGIHDPDVIEQLGRRFHLHPLLLEDVLNTSGRPKIDDYDDYLFMVLKMLDYIGDEHRLEHLHVCLVSGSTYVISLQEHEADIFAPVKERIRKGKGRIRKAGPDYLVYSLIDIIVDQYFRVLADLGEQVETLQDEVLAKPEPATLREIHDVRRQVIYIRKTIWPVREIATSLLRSDSSLIQPQTQVFLRDVYDHTIQVAETIEMFREVLASVLDIYLSSVNNRMSEVMKVLTIIATIFIPLTFIAGIYGMNFEFMPELEWRYAYPAVWFVFLAVGCGMTAWFKYKKWF